MTDIARLNDKFRKTFTGGQVLLTAGIDSKPKDDVANILLMVQNFNDFSEELLVHHHNAYAIRI